MPVHGNNRLRHDAGERDRLLVSLLPLVKQVALQIRRRLPSHIELDDLIGEGTMGLMDAVEKFDPAKQVKIESYARHRIRGAILDALRREDPASRGLRCKIRKVESASHSLECRLGRPATPGEIAEALGISLQEFYRTARELQEVSALGGSFSDTLEPGHRLNSESWMAPDSEDPFAACCRQERREILARAMNCLSERDRQIIVLYYQNSMTMKRIGERFGVDESRISQIHSRALGHLGECVRAVVERPQILGPSLMSAGMPAHL